MRADRAKERLILRATLVAQTALHVGAGASDGVVADLDIARDGSGRPVIVGTSLAGCLRAESFARLGDDEQLLAAWRALFGTTHADPFVVERDDGAAASLLRVDDAPLDGDPDSARIERRDHVAIDATSGAAADRLKYDRVVVAAGAAFQARLELTRPAADPDGADRRLFLLLAALLQDGIMLGASTSRGLGRLKARERPTLHREDLSSRDGVLAALRTRLGFDEGESVEWPRPTTPTPATRCEIAISWRPRGALLVRAGEEGEHIDTLPLWTSVDDDGVALLLPGSSIKGALRAAAERIVRTAVGLDGSASAGAVPLTGELFGLAKGAREDAGRSALLVADVTATQTFSHETWAAALRLQDPDGTTTLPVQDRDDPASSGDTAHAVVMTHVALDRWTQGASDHRLFQVLEITGLEWAELRLTIDVRRLESADLRLAAGVLVTNVLAELATGDLPLGGMTTRGHGAIEVTGVNVDNGELIGVQVAGDRLALVDPATSRSTWRSVLGAAP